jgi:alpha-L-rhamnosidase
LLVVDYWQYSGDAALVREVAPQVFGLLDKFASWRGANGLISEAPDYMFMDWVSLGGVACHHPPAVIGQGYLTAFYYRALADGIRVAELVSERTRSEDYQRRRAEVAAAFNRELWDEAKGLYRDGRPFQTHVKPGKWLPADQLIETFSPHVNALAVLYDLAPMERHLAIMERVMSEQPQPNCQPYFMHFVFDALAHAGLFDRFAVPQMERWHIDSATKTFREMWERGDMSHGWGGTPLIQMSARILGVTPMEPGFKTIAIRPQLCGLTWAKGTVPTPQGEVAVAWHRDERELVLDVTVPNGTSAEVSLPIGRLPSANITCDGDNCSGGGAIHVAGGRHRLVVH